MLHLVQVTIQDQETQLSQTRDLRTVPLTWLPRAEGFVELNHMDRNLVLAAAKFPQQVVPDPLNNPERWYAERRRRGDITAIVAYPPGQRPVIWGAYQHLPDDLPRHSNGGTGGGSTTPTTMRALRRRIVEQGLVIRPGGHHDRVETPDGHLVSALPRTPSDHRTIPNVCAQLRRKGYPV